MNALLLVLVGTAIVLAAWAWSNRGLDGSAHVALVAVLGVTAAAFNVVVPIASVEATSTVVLCTGLVLGSRLAIATGITAIVASSVTGGIGAWTIWQVVAVSVIALAAAAVGAAGRDRDWFAPPARVLLGLLAAACTVAYDVIVTVPSVLTYTVPGAGGPWQQAWAALLLGAAFTATHVVFTTAFTVLGGPPLLHALQRARPRLDGGRVEAA